MVSQPVSIEVESDVACFRYSYLFEYPRKRGVSEVPNTDASSGQTMATVGYEMTEYVRSTYLAGKL